jgi:hypothetical protein
MMLFDSFRDEVYQNGKFVVEEPPEVTLFTQKHLAHSLSVGAWFTKYYTITHDTNERVEKGDLYEEYQLQQGESAIGKIKFYHEMKAIKVTEVKSSGTRYYIGMKRNQVE